MPELLRRTVVAPAGGVNYAVKPHLLTPQQWFALQRVRCRFGVLSTFPSISNPGGQINGTAPAFVSLIHDYIQLNGVHFLIVANATNIYLVSGGLGSIDTPTYTTLNTGMTPSIAYPWSTVDFNDVCYITNRNDGVWKYGGTGAFTKITGAPNGWFVNALREHLVTFGDGNYGQRIRWCTQLTDNDWVATATNDAGQFDIIDTNDQAMGLYALQDDLAAYKERSIHALTYVGGNEVIARRPMVMDVGLISPYAIAAFSDKHIGMSAKGFFLYTGGVDVDSTIGDPIRDIVYENIHPLYRRAVRTLIKFDTQEILFAYPTVDSPPITANQGVCNMVVVFNYKTNVWYGPFPLAVDFFGATIAGTVPVIDSVHAIINTITNTIDSYSYPAGTSQYIVGYGGGPGGTFSRLSVFEEASYDHTATSGHAAETGDIFLGAEATDYIGNNVALPPGGVFRLESVNLELFAVQGEINPALFVSMFVGHRFDLNDNIIWDGPYKVTCTASQTVRVPVRCTGRWFRLRFTFPDDVRLTLAGYQFLFSYMGTR
jgi:hypothetical protein